MLATWLTAIRGAGWFTDRHIGTLFLLPETWQGWLAFAAFFIMLVGSIPFNADNGWPLRIVATIGYLGVS